MAWHGTFLDTNKLHHRYTCRHDDWCAVSMKIYIKYMVSLRCRLLVKDELSKLNIHSAVIELGMVEILEDITARQLEDLRLNLLRSGLEVLDDKKAILIERIKNVITELIHYSDNLTVLNYSD